MKKYVKTERFGLVELPTEEEGREIDAGIAADPDTYEMTAKEIARLKRMGRPLADNPKQPVSIRLSPEVTEYFRSTGKGWQGRIDKILLNHVRKS